MKFRILVFVYFAFLPAVLAQRSYSGNVLDANDKKYLEGVSVEVIGTDQLQTTNARGYFSVQGESGDTLRLSFPGFLEQKIVLAEETFLMVQIQDRARLLPTFEVKSEPYAFRFKDGKLTLIDPDEEKDRSTKGGISAGYLNSPSGGIAIAGVLSSLTKRAKQEREYQKKQEWMRRRAGYYAVIESDSVRQNLIVKYQLERSDWDRIIIRFNEGNSYHEFLDWSEERVYTTLSEFINRESNWIN
ncbi:carboxypeptidase-like regulatory domain-containing protein [Algoriphagus antarcticus]|uniref:Carboxypeptidase-like protein n=1 Tax=Algoriphagus antarcticus TaxID=238540 RepID=A0A3E0E2X2_9BACT|nr:carboxypeptidase-like regulatory domain-containing protein [Algoriphagus antarcticus]REG92632.1 carboxypeptidase-like protein [Algoriphagus antarcticus]